MSVLGQGHSGVVVLHTKDSVKKYYKAERSWQEEKDFLTFLADIQKQGFTIGCTIPKLLDSSEGSWKVEGKTYRHCNTMGFVPGVQSNANFTDEQLEILGTHIGSILYAMHHGSEPYVEQYADQFGDKDELVAHIFDDNAAKVIKVLREETDKDVLGKVKEVLAYLQSKKNLLLADRTLTHTDLNQPNILVNEDSHVQGLVDWGSFGYTNPSLTMYQLATKPKLWPHIKEQYKKLGGEIMEDIVFAAATIHLAWSPIICAELDLPLPKDRTREVFEQMYKNFQQATTSTS